VQILIEIKNLTKRYRDGTEALRSVSVRMDRKVTAVLGRNGAGKTTLTRILSTQLEPTSGTATVSGIDVMKNTEKVREIIVSIPQEARPIGILTPLEHIVIYLTARGLSIKESRGRGLSALKKLGMLREKNRLADDLSGGAKRKIFVAMAIAADAGMTFLDEPTTGLDPVSRLEVWSAIRELRGDVLLTTHYIDEAKALSDEVILMEAGKIFAKGSIADLLGPYSGMVKVEGIKAGRLNFKIGSSDISYVKREDAEKYLKMKLDVGNVDIEDLFIMRGVPDGI
jgi:ABC-2 type transport system ATP-binding protein